MFCSVSHLGSHIDEAVREKIWSNAYVDIWSLISIDQHTVDKERRVVDPRPVDRKVKVAKTMNNWLQAFAVLGCVMGEKHPERCSQLFVYFDTIYNAYKSHGGAAWWRYDEEFRRRLALHPEIGWDSKATDLWLRLMMAQKPSFPSGATGAGASPASGSVASRRPGTCWLFNEGHCKFYGLCKFKHECSACGGNHAATRCPKPAPSAANRPPAAQGNPKDPSERTRDGAMAGSVPR